MKIIDKNTGKIIATIITNHSMTIEEACDIAGIEYMITDEDWEDGEKYDITTLEMDYDED